MGEGAVLVVEDDPVVARALGRVIRRHLRALFATDVAAALRMLNDLLSTTTLRALIVDIRLPDGSGLDVLAQARRQYPSMPALVLTGHLTPSTSTQRI